MKDDPSERRQELLDAVRKARNTLDYAADDLAAVEDLLAEEEDVDGTGPDATNHGVARSERRLRKTATELMALAHSLREVTS